MLQLKHALREDFAGIAAEIEAREKEIEEKIEAASGKKKTTYKPTGRQAFGEHLLHKYTYEDQEGIDLSKATLVGQDKTEVLNYTPATIWVDTHVRNKYIICLVLKKKQKKREYGRITA